MIVHHSWCNGKVQFTTDTEEVAAWIAAHSSKLANQAIFTGKDNYGIVGNRSSRPNAEFQGAFDSGKSKGKR